MGNQGLSDMSEYMEEQSLIMETGRPQKDTLSIDKQLAQVNYQKSLLLHDYNSGPKQENGSRYLSLNKQSKKDVQLFLSTHQYQKEVQMLHTAYMIEDIMAIVGVVDHPTRLDSPLPIKHEWAPPLTTLGALATELLCEMFELDDEADMEGLAYSQELIKISRFKKNVMKTNLDVKLIQNLQNMNQDRREWSLILLTILVTDDIDFQNYFSKTNMINCLIPLMHCENCIQVRTLAFEVLAFLIIGRNHLVDLFFSSEKAVFLLSEFFRLDHLNVMYRTVYGLIQLIDSVRQQQAQQLKVARYLYLLGDSLIQIQEDLLFIQAYANEDDNNKRLYILTAIKRILEFVTDNIEKESPFNIETSQLVTEEYEIDDEEDAQKTKQKPQDSQIIHSNSQIGKTNSHNSQLIN